MDVDIQKKIIDFLLQEVEDKRITENNLDIIFIVQLTVTIINMLIEQDAFTLDDFKKFTKDFKEVFLSMELKNKNK